MSRERHIHTNTLGLLYDWLHPATLNRGISTEGHIHSNTLGLPYDWLPPATLIRGISRENLNATDITFNNRPPLWLTATQLSIFVILPKPLVNVYAWLNSDNKPVKISVWSYHYSLMNLLALNKGIIRFVYINVPHISTVTSSIQCVM